MKQEIQFCTTSDGISIAYASVGSGPPLVKAANWMNHLELDWRSPVWRHLLSEFSRDQRVIRYDERGTGLSERRVKDLSLDAFVEDLERVVDAVGLDRFPLLGISQGGPVAVAYATRHPEKVSELVLCGSFSAGWRKSRLPEEVLAKREAQLTLIRQGWDNRNPAMRQFWTTMCIPDSLPEEADSFNNIQFESVTAETAARIFEAIGDIDVRELLPKLNLPVLVLHCRGDAAVPFEEGRRLASMIPNAKFIPLDSNNHLVLQGEPAWPVFVDEVRQFLGRPMSRNAAAITEIFRRPCPTCGRVYEDPTLNYCLDDGSLLTSDDGSEQTQVLPTLDPS